jgi:hypothetical protein
VARPSFALGVAASCALSGYTSRQRKFSLVFANAVTGSALLFHSGVCLGFPGRGSVRMIEPLGSSHSLHKQTGNPNQSICPQCLCAGYR